MNLSVTWAGKVRLDGTLDPEAGAVVKGAVDAEIDSWFRAGILDGDPRSRSALNAAALTSICARAGHAGARGGQPRPLINAIIDLDTLTGRVPTPDSPNMGAWSDLVGFGPVHPDIIRRLLCEADVSRIVTRGTSEILDVGMRSRLATPAQRRAVLVRSGGHCEVGNCDAPYDHRQLHHLDPYNPQADTGPTNLDNLVAACTHHHKLLHEGHHTLQHTPSGTYQLHHPDGTPITNTKTYRTPHPRRHHNPPPEQAA